jgi:hypothetical protein
VGRGGSGDRAAADDRGLTHAGEVEGAVSYTTPAVFKQALGARLRGGHGDRQGPRSRSETARVRARLAASVHSLWRRRRALERCGARAATRARTIQDIAVRANGEPGTLEELCGAGAIHAGDSLRFLLRADAAQPEMKGDGVIYDSRRFCVEAQLAGKLYGTAFGADIAMCDPIHGVAEELHGSELLAFIGPVVAFDPRETRSAPFWTSSCARDRTRLLCLSSRLSPSRGCRACVPQQGSGCHLGGCMIRWRKMRTGAGAPVAVHCAGERGSAIEA